MKRFVQARVNGGSNYDSLNDQPDQPPCLTQRDFPAVRVGNGLPSGKPAEELGKGVLTLRRSRAVPPTAARSSGHVLHRKDTDIGFGSVRNGLTHFHEVGVGSKYTSPESLLVGRGD